MAATRTVAAVASGLSLLVLLAGCGEEAAPVREVPGPPSTVDTHVGAGHGSNLLLVTLDTTRADRLGCYGHSGARTPGVDRLAREGVRAARVLTSAPVTLPSHTSILSGVHPIGHGVHDNGLFQVPDSTRLLSEVLQAEGYSTAAFVSAHVLDSTYGLDQGFDSYDDTMEDRSGVGVGATERRATQTVDAALSWLSQRTDEPWFLWLHLFDPHEPHRPPAPFDGQFLNPYDGEIAYADQQLSRLLEVVRSDEGSRSTLIALTADHGEGLGQHGEGSHGYFVYDTTMWVPLILQHPLLPRGMVLEGQQSVVDLFPTVLDFLGLDAGDGLDGRSFLTALGDDAPETWHAAYLENQLPYFSYEVAPVDGVCNEQYKYIRAPRPELYDYRADPQESRNLWQEGSATVAAMEQLLLEARAGREPLALGPNRALSEADSSLLAQLGYVRGGATSAEDWLDPKDYPRIQLRFREADGLMTARRMKEAADLLRGILKECPNHSGAQSLLGQIYVSQSFYDQGVPLLLESLRRRPDDSVPARVLALSYVNLQEWDKALGMYDHLLARMPGDLRVALEASGAALRAGAEERALEYLQPFVQTSLPADAQQTFQARWSEVQRAIEAAQADGR